MPQRLQRPAQLGIAAAIGLSAATCGSVEPFGCIEDDQCDAKAQGRCVAPGHCAFPDPACEGGYRYHETAGRLAGICVEVVGGGTTTGSTGEPPSGESSSGDPGSTGASTTGFADATTTTTGGDSDGSTTAGDSGSAGGDSSTGSDCEGGLCPCATEISVGNTHNCVVRTDNSVVCWGRDHLGQLGSGEADNPPSPHPQLVPLPPGRVVERLSSNANNTCAALGDGSVWCWGTNDFNQSGVTLDPKELVAPPTSDNGVTDGTLVAPMLQSTCAVAVDDLMTCWGRNHQGQLATDLAEPGPHQTGPHLAGATGMEGGFGHACMHNALEVWCWGQGNFGQHGFGMKAGPVNMPAPPPAFVLDGGVVGVGAGRLHTCVVHGGGTIIECVGRNLEAQIDLTAETAFDPVVVDLGIEDPVVAIRTRQDTTCVQVDNGDLYCWGSSFGFDHGTAFENGVPLFPPGRVVAADEIPDAIVDYGVGTRHVCAVTDTNRVHCWGSDAQEQLGATDPGPGMRTVEIELNCP